MSNPTVTIGTKVRAVTMHPGIGADIFAARPGTTGTVVHLPDSQGDLMVRFDVDGAHYYVREWVLADAILPPTAPTFFAKEQDLTLAANVPGWQDGLKVRVVSHPNVHSVVGKTGTTRTDRNGWACVVADDHDPVELANWTRLDVLPAEVRTFTKDSRRASANQVEGWEPGLRVRITGHLDMHHLVGAEGVTEGTNDEDARVLIEGHHSGVHTVVNWTALEVLPAEQSEPVDEVVSETTVDPEVARLQAEVERLTKREEDLVEAMHEEAQRRGWGDALKVVLTEVGLALKPVEVKVTLDVKRKARLAYYDFTEEQRTSMSLHGDRPIHGYVEWTERVTLTDPPRTVDEDGNCLCKGRHAVTVEDRVEYARRVNEMISPRISVTHEDITVLQQRCAYCG